MNRQNIHATERQIEEYLSDKQGLQGSISGPTSFPGPLENSFGEASGTESKYVELHIEECGLCRKKVLEAESKLLGIRKRRPAKTPYKECPSTEVLQDYAAGLSTAETASQVIHHAADCNFCGPLLKTYIQDLSGDLSLEAQEFLNQLPPVNPQWPRPTLLARLKRLFSRVAAELTWQRLAIPGLAGTTLVFCTPMIVSKVQLKKADTLVVAAFVENPRTNLRYAWTPHTFDVKLGGSNGAGDSGSDALHEIQYLADQKKYSSNPNWLRINGRVALLNKDVHAVDFLKKAYEQGLRDPDTEIDLAAAYFLRDTSNSAGQNPPRVPDVNATVDMLLKILKEEKLTPDERAAALFNLAVAYETMLRWDQAALVWEKQYLRLDATGPWAEEAERHLTTDKSKMQPPRPEGYKSPAFFEDHSSDPETQNRIEEYQDAALRTWLLDVIGRDAAEARAVRRLAETLEEQHGDSWMKDYLSSRRPGDSPGVEALSAAITSNRKGLPTDAIRYAEAAEKIFEQTSNSPGVLRARFEQVYANQRLLRWPACVQQTGPLDSALHGTSYRWLQIQLALTESVCLNRQDQFGAADDKIRSGREIAKRFSFHILELRAFGLDAGNKVPRNCDESGRAATAGLEVYWQGASAPMRLYELYSPIKQCLEKEKLWYAAEALQRRMIAILEAEVDEDKNETLILTAREALKVSLTAINERLPESSWNPLHQDPAFATYQLPIKLELAELQLLGGDAQSALATMDAAGPLVATTPDQVIHLNFYRIKGDVLLKLQRLDEAGTAYKAGLEIAERAFGLLKSGEERVPWIKETDEIYCGLVGVMLEQGRKEQAFQLWEWYQSRPWILEGDHGFLPGRIFWPEIENEIRLTPAATTGTRLVYAFIKDRVYTWTIVNGSLNMPPPVKITREKMRQQISSFAQEIAVKNSNLLNLEDDSQRLFSVLLAPVAADLPEKAAVAVELDPAMNGLVIEALKSPEGWYFGQKYSVVYSPGLMKERDLRPLANRVPGQKWLLNALTVDDRRVMDLKGIEVVNAYNLKPSEFQDRLVETGIFIFLGHGELGGLRMPNRPPLQPEDFPPQSLRKLQLAGLFACSSGPAQKGLLDTTSLVHTLLSGGAPSVIASNWDVSRASTARLITSFYDHFESGDSPAHSMLAARQAAFRENRHPYYWAAFTLTGRAE